MMEYYANMFPKNRTLHVLKTINEILTKINKELHNIIEQVN